MGAKSPATGFPEWHSEVELGQSADSRTETLAAFSRPIAPLRPSSADSDHSRNDAEQGPKDDVKPQFTDVFHVRNSRRNFHV